jgi:hypothetical protein
MELTLMPGSSIISKTPLRVSLNAFQPLSVFLFCFALLFGGFLSQSSEKSLRAMKMEKKKSQAQSMRGRMTCLSRTHSEARDMDMEGRLREHGFVSYGHCIVIRMINPENFVRKNLPALIFLFRGDSLVLSLSIILDAGNALHRPCSSVDRMKICRCPCDSDS